MKTPLDVIAEKIHSGRRLFYASLELTYSCNFACRFCYNPVAREGQKRGAAKPVSTKGRLLELGEIASMMKEIRRAGVMYFTLTGGEPMVHPHFWEVASAAKEQAFALRVFTNGSLIDDVAAEKFGRLMPNCVEISIYGASEKSYGLSCGRAESFSKVMRGIELLKRKGVTVYLKCMLTKFNESEMDEIQDIADASGFPLSWDPILRQSDDGLKYPMDASPSHEAVVKLLSGRRFRTGRSAFEGEDGGGVCNIGRNLIHIDPFGNVYPCIEWNEILGNIRETGIIEIWENHPKLRELMRIAEEMTQMAKGLPPKCHYCMGQSMKKYSDPRRFDEEEIEAARIAGACGGCPEIPAKG